VKQNIISVEEFKRLATRAVSEKSFQAQVVKIAKIYDYEVYHTYISWKSKRGFPDLVLVDTRVVNNRGVIYAELKKQNGQLTPDQVHWLDILGRAGQRVFLWRPSDMDEIIAELSR
jgi:hypothetical protein